MTSAKLCRGQAKCKWSGSDRNVIGSSPSKCGPEKKIGSPVLAGPADRCPFCNCRWYEDLANEFRFLAGRPTNRRCPLLPAFLGLTISRRENQGLSAFESVPSAVLLTGAGVGFLGRLIETLAERESYVL